jgi:hypothetical protein
MVSAKQEIRAIAEGVRFKNGRIVAGVRFLEPTPNTLKPF